MILQTKYPKTYKVKNICNINLSPWYLLLNMPGFISNSGDADFVPAFSLIKELGKEVLSCSVPRGYSNELRQKFPFLVLKKELLNKCLREYKK